MTIAKRKARTAAKTVKRPNATFGMWADHTVRERSRRLRARITANARQFVTRRGLMRLIDSDVVIWNWRGQQAAGTLLAAGPFAISAVTYMELVQGMCNAQSSRS